MHEMEEVMTKIEKVRKEMNNLIKRKGNLLDPEVISASQILDSILNEYYQILKKSNK